MILNIIAVVGAFIFSALLLNSLESISRALWSIVAILCQAHKVELEYIDTPEENHGPSGI